MPNFFVHANGAYFETATDELVTSYAVGTQAVPQRPSPNHQWVSGAWSFVAPDPTLLRLSVAMEKWKVYRAMTQLKIDGSLRADGDPGAWPTIRTAMFAADPDAQAQWEAIAMVPRSETKWAFLYQGTLSAKSGDVTAANAFLDAVFARAATY